MSEADASAHAATLADWAAFLSALPSPDLAQVQQRGTSGPYNVYATLEPMVRLRPWSLHWVVTMAIGLAAMIVAALIVRYGAKRANAEPVAAAHPA